MGHRMGQIMRDAAKVDRMVFAPVFRNAAVVTGRRQTRRHKKK